MRIKIISSSQEFYNKNYRNFLSVVVDDLEVMSFVDGEPEDNTLDRNFSDCYRIADLIKSVAKWAKEGEDVFVIKEESDAWL